MRSKELIIFVIKTECTSASGVTFYPASAGELLHIFCSEILLHIMYQKRAKVTELMHLETPLLV